MGQQVVGELLARVGLDTRGLQKGVADSRGLIRGLDDNIGKHTAAFAAAGAAVTAYGVKASFTYQRVTRESGGLARVTGLNIEQASRLRFQARATGVDVNALSTGIATLSKHLIANDAAAKSLGFEYRDAAGQLLPMDEILAKIADKFRDLPEGPERTALAMKLFGRSVGVDLLPMLAKGSEGLEKLAKQGDKLGATMGKRDVEALRAYTSAQRDATLANEAFEVQVGRHTLPVLAKFKRGIAELLATAAQQPGIGDIIGMTAVAGTLAGPALAGLTALNEGVHLADRIGDARRKRALAAAGRNLAPASRVGAAVDLAAAGTAIGVAGASGISRVAALGVRALPVAGVTAGIGLGFAGGYALSKLPDVGDDDLRDQNAMKRYDAAAALARRHNMNFSVGGVDRTAFETLHQGNRGGMEKLLDREIRKLEDATRAREELRVAGERLAQSNERYMSTLRGLANAETTAELAHQRRTKEMTRSLNVFDAAPKRDAKTAKQLLADARSRVGWEDEQMKALIKLEDAGLSDLVLEDLAQIEQRAPGTLNGLAKVIGPKLVEEYNKAYMDLAYTQAYRDGVLGEGFFRAGATAAYQFATSFASHMGQLAQGVMGPAVAAAINGALRDRARDAAERGGLTAATAAPKAKAPVTVQQHNHYHGRGPSANEVARRTASRVAQAVNGG